MDDVNANGEHSVGNNGWFNGGSAAEQTQTILLTGKDDSFLHEVHSKDVTIIPSLASQNNQNLDASNMVKFKPIVNFDWVPKYYHGNLVVGHVNQIYLAYVLTCKTGGSVRVTNRKTSQRALLKNFSGAVVDISFATSDRVILGIVDAIGNLFVYEFFEGTGEKLTEKLLANCLRPATWQPAVYHRLVWCSFIGDDDKSQMSSSSPQNDDEADNLLDDSLMLILTHNELAELWHLDLLNRIYGNTQLNPDETKSGYYLINSHTKPIIDAAFSPDATAVATASLDGMVKFFQVNMSDSNIPKCLHHWMPHDGRPISFIYFLDDHKNKNPDVQLWKFVLTGCDENSEMKIWNCQTWHCLQTITFVSPSTSRLGLHDKEVAGNGDSGDRIKSGEDSNIIGHVKPCLKAKIDQSAMFLVLSDINRQVVYVMHIYKDFELTDASISFVGEFLLSHSCLSFDIIDVHAKNKKLKKKVHELLNLDGDNEEDDRNVVVHRKKWPAHAGNDDEDEEENDADGTNGLASKQSADAQFIDIQLFSVHSKALQEITIKYRAFLPGSASSCKESFPSKSSTSGGMQDLLSDSSNGVLLTPTNSPSPPLNQKQQFLQQHQPVTTAAQHNNVLTSPMTSSMTSLSSGTQAPILLRPDEFLSPSDRASITVNQDLAPVKVVKHNGGLLSTSLLQSSISSSVDFDPHRPRQPNDNNVDDDDDDDEVGEEERGDVEGADRDRPDGGTRARVGASGGAGTSGRTSGNGGDRFFDRGGDGGGDGNSSSATSSASQEVTEILEGAAGVGTMEGLSSINQEKSSSDDEDVDDGDVEDDEDDDDDETFMPHLKLMQKSQQQQQQMSSSLYMEQQQQIAHHLPNLNVMNIPPLHHHAVSSSTSSTSNQHHHQYMMSTSLFELAPVTSHSPMYHSAYHSSHPSWNAGKVAGDEAGKSLEELPVAAATNTNLAERERKSLDGLPILSKALHLADYSDGIRTLANQQPRLPEIPLKIGPTTYDIMDQLRSQDQQIKFLSSQLQLQTTQFDGSLRNLGHQLDDVSKNVDSLCVSFNRDDYAQKEALTECKLEEMFREFMMRYERSQAEHLQRTTNTLQANIDVQLEKIVSNEIKKTILPKVEQSLDVIKEKISHDVSQKLASIDNNIKINLTKMLKSKPTIDSIGQSISSELRSNLRSINQDIVVPSLEKGCQNIIEQLNASFKAGTQQYIQSLESHLNQTRKTLESHKHPAVLQLKSASETLTHFETKQQQIQTQLNATIQSLQNQISHLQQATTAVVAAVGGKNTHDEIKLFSKLNELQNMLITEVKTLLSEELVSLLKYQQVAIKDQFDAALRSVTPAPSNSSHHSDHISNKNHIIACIKASKFNDAFQTALSATDLALVEFTCESVEISVVFGNSSLLSQSVLLSLIQQLGADLNTKPELKYRFLDEAIVFLDPYDPVTKEHLDVVLKQLQVNLLDYIDRKVDSAMASKMNKLLRRTMLALRSVS